MDVRDPLVNLAYAVAELERIQATHDDALVILNARLEDALAYIVVLEARIELLGS